jgi:hypothetical protein
MLRVIKDSSVISVILVSDGSQKMIGTPFDDPINESYKLWHDQQQKVKQPLVTVLRGVGGKITDFTVTPLPFPVDLPALPPESALSINEKTTPTNSQKTPAAVVPPLIISGKKPEALKTEAPHTLTKVEVPVPAPEPPKSQPTAIQPSKLVQESASPQKSEPPPATTAAPVTVKAPDPKPEEPVASSKIQTPQPVPAESSRTEPPPSPSSKTAATKPSLATSTKMEPPETKVDSTTSANSGPPASASSAAQGTLAIAPTPFFANKVVWIAGALFLIVAVGFGFVFFRRQRTAPPASLITRSFDRDQK